mgnify:CR=1 FL=1
MYGLFHRETKSVYRFYTNVDFFVINTGGLAITYQAPESSVQFFSTPYVATLREAVKRFGHGAGESKDLIDLIREEYEFKDTLAVAQNFLQIARYRLE